MESKAVEFIRKIVGVTPRPEARRAHVMMGDQVVIENIPEIQAREMASGMGSEYSIKTL